MPVMGRTADPIEECPVGTADEQYLDDRLAASYLGRDRACGRGDRHGTPAPPGLWLTELELLLSACRELRDTDSADDRGWMRQSEVCEKTHEG